eukprot:jgi/Chlat1/4566/Chrsp29S04465
MDADADHHIDCDDDDDDVEQGSNGGGGGPNVRFCTLSRLSDGVVVASWAHKHADPECLETVGRVVGSGNLKANSQLTVTVNERVGTLHLHSQDAEVFAVVTSASYPRRSAFRLLQDLRDRARSDLGNDLANLVGNAAGAGALTKQCTGFMKELCLRYADLSQVDKITAVGMKVDEVKAVMEGNINKVLANTENIKSVENKSEALRLDAQRFQTQSKSLKNQMWWRNFKVKIIVAIVVLVLLLFIFVPIIIRFT